MNEGIGRIKSKLLLVLIVSLLLIVGCAKKQIIWDNPSSNESQFKVDNGNCVMYARQLQAADEIQTGTITNMNTMGGAIAGGIVGGLSSGNKFNTSYKECMELKGYTERP